MDEKRRRRFVGYCYDPYPDTKSKWFKACEGLLYDEGNVQVLWRSDIGHTAQQYDSIAKVFDLVPGLNRIDLWGDDDA